MHNVKMIKTIEYPKKGFGDIRSVNHYSCHAFQNLTTVLQEGDSSFCDLVNYCMQNGKNFFNWRFLEVLHRSKRIKKNVSDFSENAVTFPIH